VLNYDLKSGCICYGHLADVRLNGLTSKTADQTNAELNQKTLVARAGVKKDILRVCLSSKDIRASYKLAGRG